jgi:hypothetical protein
VIVHADYDSPWKEMLERFFPQFLLHFFPDIYVEIDWSQGFEFLESELQQITRGAATGRRRVDKLVKVFLKSGEEQWVLIHVEVQGQRDEEFPERVYIYNYRIYDIFQRPVVSLAVLTDDSPAWRPDSFGYEQWKVRVNLTFRMVKLLDWQVRWAKLEPDTNPFAVVVMAHLKTLETRQDPEDRRAWKWTLTRMLYERNYRWEEIIDLYRFIDWIMTLPLELEQAFRQVLEEYEEAHRMQYISVIERIARQEGIEQGIEEGIEQALRKATVDVLEERFGTVSESLKTVLEAVEEIAQLEKLLRRAVTIESLAAFEDFIHPSGITK